MASGKEYLEFVLEQLSGAEQVTFRPMMGEYILYCQGKIIGGIYDNRFLVKPCAAARRLLPDAPAEIPYPGAKEMLLVEEIEDRPLMTALLTAMAAELPEPKQKQRKRPCSG